MLLRICLLSLVLVGTACDPPWERPAAADLDFLEVVDHSGWRLRVHGDGGGSLTHRQLPTHHLHYPAATFTVGPGRELTRRCRGTVSTPVCTQLRYYDSARDRTATCPCAPGDWAATLMATAIARMDVAVDAGASPRSCRMLRRRWLASNAPARRRAN